LVDEWVLVRLSEPLIERGIDGTLALETGRDQLDAAIDRLGIRRIELAITPTDQGRSDPETFRGYGLDRIYKFHLPPGADVFAAVAELRNVTGVAHVEADYFVEVLTRNPGDQLSPDAAPNDPLFADQWALDNRGQSGGTADADISAQEAWDHTSGGPVLIGFLDTGVDTDHEDLWAKLDLDDAWDFINDDDDPEDDNGHGTGMAGILAASTDNGLGMAGVCWGCRILPIKAFDDNATGTYSTMADAFVWATDHGARVQNMSAGKAFGSDTLLRAVGYAADAGSVITAAAGNSPGVLRYPAGYRETIALGGTDHDDRLCSFSARGEAIDLVAPAEVILSTQMNGEYKDDWTGTSCAAPHAAGVVGLIATVNPSLGREEARHLLHAGADDEVGDPVQDTPGFDTYHGWGRLNADRSVRGALSNVSLRVEGKSATRIHLDTSSPGAESYDFVRGDLASLREEPTGVDVGDVVCLENDSPDPDLAGDEDTATPSPGSAFFYLARANHAATTASYGGSSRHRDRLVRVNPDWSVSGEQEGQYLGDACSPAGDVNADGYDDVVVISDGWDGTAGPDVGRADLYLGGPSGLADSPAWTQEGDRAHAIGYGAAAAGDVNGDGYADVVITAPYLDLEFEDQGRGSLYLGSANGLSEDPDWTYDGSAEDDYMGSWAEGIGDVNGDGYDDLAICAMGYDADHLDGGRVLVFYGSPTGLPETPNWHIDGNQEGAQICSSAAYGLETPDVNADGYDDLIIASIYYDGPDTDEGRAWVHLGGPGGPSDTADTVLEIDQAHARFGWGGLAGDVNADGYDDLVLGAYYYDHGETNEGGAWVFLGSPGGVDPTPAWSTEGEQNSAELGYVPSRAGDIDGDGYDDIVIGAMEYDEERTNGGLARVHRGTATGVSDEVFWSTVGTQTLDELGYVTTSAGDVNGDGEEDLLIAIIHYHRDHPDQGRAVVYYGPLPFTTDCPR
jgi:hypothetical protein